MGKEKENTDNVSFVKHLNKKKKKKRKRNFLIFLCNLLEYVGAPNYITSNGNHQAVSQRCNCWCCYLCCFVVFFCTTWTQMNCIFFSWFVEYLDFHFRDQTWKENKILSNLSSIKWKFELRDKMRKFIVAINWFKQLLIKYFRVPKLLVISNWNDILIGNSEKEMLRFKCEKSQLNFRFVWNVDFIFLLVYVCFFEWSHWWNKIHITIIIHGTYELQVIKIKFDYEFWTQKVKDRQKKKPYVLCG